MPRGDGEMALLKEKELGLVAQAIAVIEKQTDAELVTVLAKRSDNYYYIPALIAAMIALAVPVLLKLTPLWLDADELLMAQWLTFLVCAAVFRVPAIMMRLVPASIKQWRASSMARRQFLDNNLHHTAGDMGVLIFVSQAEHYVEIIADRGIAQHVSHEQWKQIVDQFTDDVKAGNVESGFIDCIERCGELMKQYAPATSVKNELPNHLVVI